MARGAIVRGFGPIFHFARDLAVSQFEFRPSTESGAARSIFDEDFKALFVIEDYAAAILLTNARASMITGWISHTSRHFRRLPDRWSAA
jgi:hypothetical protein